MPFDVADAYGPRSGQLPPIYYPTGGDPTYVTVVESMLVTGDWGTPSFDVGGAFVSASQAGSVITSTKVSDGGTARGPGAALSVSWLIDPLLHVPGWTDDGTSALGVRITGVTAPAESGTVQPTMGVLLSYNAGDVTDASSEMVGMGIEFGGAGLWRATTCDRTGQSGNVALDTNDVFIGTWGVLGNPSAGERFGNVLVGAQDGADAGGQRTNANLVAPFVSSRIVIYHGNLNPSVATNLTMGVTIELTRIALPPR